jgi:peptidoglycan/xylan/chitin deacetylase (PgdA/CDA1 family)
MRRPRFPFLAALVGLLLSLILATPAAAAGNATLLFNGSRVKPVIALTFDDGWSTTNCSKILNILVADQVPATFFPNAIYVNGSPAARTFWRRVATLGFPIGDHTYNHKSLPTLSFAAAVWEISHDRTVVEAATGVPLIRVLRPPYGADNAATLREAAAAGFSRVLNWDTSDADTALHSSAAAMTTAGLRGLNGSVVLMHCGPNVTPTILPAIIAGYRARGFRFVTVPQLFGFAGPVPHFP